MSSKEIKPIVSFLALLSAVCVAALIAVGSW